MYSMFGLNINLFGLKIYTVGLKIHVFGIKTYARDYFSTCCWTVSPFRWTV